MSSLRLERLPETIRREIKTARRELGWSQLELGRRVGLAQRHVSGIETGRIVPRYDTLIDLLRTLNRDLVLVPRELVPVVQSLVKDYRNRESPGGVRDRPLYAVGGDGDGDDQEEEDTDSRPESGG